MAATSVKPLVVITGPTASGKTSLAIDLAKRYGGEIICADSRTIYRGMDIGTAKPTVEERRGVPHWGLDLVDPGESFSAAQFKAYAEQKITEIRQRSRLPFLVGGTGLYVDAVIFDFQFGSQADERLRQTLADMSVEELQNHCHKNNIELPENKKNKRYLIRKIEQNGAKIRGSIAPRDDCIVVGITTNKKELRTKIEFRAEQIFENNVVEEAIALGEKYGWQSEAMTGNIYPIIYRYIQGDIDEVELRRQFVLSDWHLVKRQLTWLRRNPYLLWGDIQAIEHYLSQLLANTYIL